MTKRGEARDSRAEQRNLDARQAADQANPAAKQEPGGATPSREGVLVQICLECGKEYTFEDMPPPDDLTCEKCGSVVFRSFFSGADDDDVMQDYRDMTERDLAPDDAESDATRADVLDLNNL
jgi:DNA-directed RNA polymerase subunit RPC12/RpoP